MAHVAGHHDQQHQQPERMRVPGLERPEVAVGNRRPDQQSRNGKRQQVGQLPLRERDAREAVQRRLRIEQHQQYGPECSGHFRRADRVGAQQRRGDQRQLRGDARIQLGGMVVTEGGQRGHAQQHGRHGKRNRQACRDGARQSGDGKRPDSRREFARCCGLAALPFQPDGQRHAQGDGEREQGRHPDCRRHNRAGFQYACGNGTGLDLAQPPASAAYLETAARDNTRRSYPSVTSRPNGVRPAGQRGQYCTLPG